MDDDTFEILEFPVTPNYSPVVSFDVMGVSGPKPLVGIVDTGFTGFLQIPLADGIAASLNLWGISRSTLADGRIVKDLQCYGRIRFGGKELWGIISLSETGNDCLLGMQFLNMLKADFTVSPTLKKSIFRIPVPKKDVAIDVRPKPAEKEIGQAPQPTSKKHKSSK